MLSDEEVFLAKPRVPERAEETRLPHLEVHGRRRRNPPSRSRRVRISLVKRRKKKVFVGFGWEKESRTVGGRGGEGFWGGPGGGRDEGGGGGSLMVEPVQCGECRYGKIKVFYTNTLGLREVGVTLLKPASLSYPSTAGLGTPPRLHRGRTAWGTPRIPRTCEQPRARSSLLLLANSKGITLMFFKLKVS